MSDHDYSILVSHAMTIVTQAAGEITRPSAVWKPRIYIDGNQWCALYGDNLQEGVAGFGSSPDAAMRDFDAAWFKPLKGARHG